MLYEISITSLGGSLKCGFVENNDEIDLFNEYIKWNNDIKLKNKLIDNLDNDDEKYVDYEKYNNIFDINGISSLFYLTNEKKIKVYSIENDSKNEILSLDDKIFDNDITLNNPFFYKNINEDVLLCTIDSEVKEFPIKNPNTLMFFGFYLKNDSEIKIQFNLKDNENFDIDNLFFGCIDFTEQFAEISFISKYYYFDKETQIKLYKLIHCYYFDQTSCDEEDSVDLIDESSIDKFDVSSSISMFFNEISSDISDDINILNNNIVKEIYEVLKTGECQIIDYIEQKNENFEFEKTIIKDLNENKLYERLYE